MCHQVHHFFHQNTCICNFLCKLQHTPISTHSNSRERHQFCLICSTCQLLCLGSYFSLWFVKWDDATLCHAVSGVSLSIFKCSWEGKKSGRRKKVARKRLMVKQQTQAFKILISGWRQIRVANILFQHCQCVNIFYWLKC